MECSVHKGVTRMIHTSMQCPGAEIISPRVLVGVASINDNGVLH